MNNNSTPTDFQTLEEAAAEVELERSKSSATTPARAAPLTTRPCMPTTKPPPPDPSGELAEASPEVDSEASKASFDPSTSTESKPMSFHPDTFIDDSLVLAPKASAKKKKKDDRPPLVLSTYAPRLSARKIVRRYFTSEKGYRTIRYHKGSFYTYTSTHYQECDKEKMRVMLYGYLSVALRLYKGEEFPFDPTKTKVDWVFDALKSVCYVDENLSLPVRLPGAEYIPATGMVAFKNVLLHLPTGRPYEHTPAFFGCQVLPFDYDPDPEAPAPKQWLKFLNDLWGDDRESIETLQEWFGYCLTADTSRQKMLMVIGPKRSGKGTIARIQSKLLGRGNVCSPTLSSLTKPFGLQNLINKRLAVVSDARLNKGSAVVEKLLGISGEDAVDVARKFCTDWHGTLSTRFMIMSNELPRIWDASGALASRFIILQLTESFYGKEDPQLTERLATELPGILNWAIVGWQRLHQRRYFIQPKSSGELALELENLGSPVAEFVHECCVVGDFSVSTDELFDAWKKWCESQGTTPGAKSIFGKNLRAAVPSIKKSHPREGEGRHWKYKGVKLQ